MTDLTSSCDKLKLQGYDIHIYEDCIKIFVGKKTLPDEFKPKADKLVRYLIDELFIPNKPVKVDILTK